MGLLYVNMFGFVNEYLGIELFARYSVAQMCS
jgi:hypothetical protein